MTASGSASIEPAASGKPATSASLIRRLLSLAWRYRSGCVRVVVQQAFLVLLSLGAVSFTGLAIDVIRAAVDPRATPPEWPLGWEPPTSWTPLGMVCAIAGLTLASALAHALLRFRAAITLAWLTQAIVLDLRRRVYDKLQRLSFRFFDANQSGSIINRVAGDVQSVRMFVDGVIIQAITVVLSLAMYLAYMLSVHVWLTLACLATTPLLWVAGVWFSRSVKPAYLENSRLTIRSC